MKTKIIGLITVMLIAFFAGSLWAADAPLFPGEKVLVASADVQEGGDEAPATEEGDEPADEEGGDEEPADEEPADEAPEEAPKD